MDARTNMIIAKGKIVTLDVAYCSLNPATNKWDITFKSGKEFHYSRQNVVWLRNPVSLNPSIYSVRFNGKVLDNITAILSFKNGNREYWHICFSSGYEHSYNISELEIQKSCLANDKSKQVFNYLRCVAEKVSVRTEDGTAILRNQYEKIDFLGGDTAVAVYLNPDEYAAASGLQVDASIFPFGCNKSQFAAVANALSNRISIIEGPPGTGKTQTILNIIANLVLNGKTVQVVSNNNSAIENIAEKLASPAYKLDYFVASLGKTEKKQAFISNQTGRLPDLRSFADEQYDTCEFYEEVKKQSAELGHIFDMQNRLAALKQEKYSINLEAEHYAEIGIQPDNAIATKRNLNSAQLIRLLVECQEIFASLKKPGLITKFLFRIRYGISVRNILKSGQIAIETAIQSKFYKARKEEIDFEINELEERLNNSDANLRISDFTSKSLACFKSMLAKRYAKTERRIFMEDDLWKDPAEFLKEYPVVLSTTYTARSSLGKNALFDYVIMDEASQVDVATGALALSCAKNAVIVGDTRQLSNVVTSAEKPILQEIFNLAHIPQAYNFAENSFLDSIFSLLENRIPRTILREHYRCDPQIIGYCNHKFYHDELIVMTEGAGNALELFATNAGRHAREHGNLRQAEIIRDEILPTLDSPKEEIGIITPYRNQVTTVKQVINDPKIDVATIHKFQGREKEVIIFTTVDDIVTEFSDDSNLLNVAVSRAKQRFILVASDEEQPQNSNIGDLIGYIRYNNCNVSHSAISSVFDKLYKPYKAERLAYLKKHKRISEYDSENLMFGLIEEVLESRQEALGIVSHQPLYQLIRDYSRLTSEEERFVKTGLSHLDFLIYNKVTKKPVLAVEVDGYRFHKEGSKQAERDALKNHILEVYRIPLIRFATNGSGEKEKLSSKLESVLSSSN